MMLEEAPTTSRAISIREPELHARSGLPELPAMSNLAQTPTSRWNPASQAHGDGTPRAEETGDSEDKIALSPNTRRVLTRL